MTLSANELLFWRRCSLAPCLLRVPRLRREITATRTIGRRRRPLDERQVALDNGAFAGAETIVPLNGSGL